MNSAVVMSFNVHYGVGSDEQYNIERTADAIRSAGADIVGLQEVDAHWGERSRHEHMAEKLAELLGMNVFFAPIYELPPAAGGRLARRFGVAVLTRHPIVRAVNHPLTRLSTQEKEARPAPMPGFAEVQLDVRGTPLTVYVVHLDYRADPTVRAVQIEELLAIVGEDRYGKLLMGDFNAGPDAPELRPLFAAFRDAWDEAKGNGFTFPAAQPRIKIDYILIGEGMEVVDSSVPDSSASDHRPVVARLALLPNE
ncbi:endonuclease/exonuclease/phosphatase family protein [Paenibacillus sp. GYB003]|uniref:endonuclease/exonuclease/phosphatase family protein n=1 Tax=Paenibacillus sp. GYB003 TaxID=2994392 RepID=UPI002F962695